MDQFRDVFFRHKNISVFSKIQFRKGLEWFLQNVKLLIYLTFQTKTFKYKVKSPNPKIFHVQIHILREKRHRILIYISATDIRLRLGHLTFSLTYRMMMRYIYLYKKIWQKKLIVNIRTIFDWKNRDGRLFHLCLKKFIYWIRRISVEIYSYSPPPPKKPL